MAFRYAIVDAFTDRPFAGNPSAVVLIDEPRSDVWLQSLAAEMNLSETAFVDVAGGLDAEVLGLRWFTPGAEVGLCGHATLATAHLLGGSRRFQTRSGELRCVVDGDGWIEMDFPGSSFESFDATANPEVFGGLAITAIARGVDDVVAELETESDVRNFEPNFDAITKVDSRGVIVTAPSDESGIDFVSRCFYPGIGVPEDPVTGSAHCTLACWWAERLDKNDLVAHQASKRGGTIRLSVRGERVHLFGRAVTVASGVLGIS